MRRMLLAVTCVSLGMASLFAVASLVFGYRKSIKSSDAPLQDIRRLRKLHDAYLDYQASTGNPPKSSNELLASTAGSDLSEADMKYFTVTWGMPIKLARDAKPAVLAYPKDLPYEPVPVLYSTGTIATYERDQAVQIISSGQ